MRRSRADGGSMDMLLDTMCNTFGGVCFIALMVSILSAALPNASSENEAQAPKVTESDIVSREMAKLLQRRDELKSAIEIQKEFLSRSSTGVVVRADLMKMSEEIASNNDQIRLYEKKRVEYLDELAKLKTKTDYNKREAARLARMVKDLEEQNGKPLFDRHRVVRTPREREIQGLKIINVWLHERRMYMMDDPACAKWTKTGATTSDCTLVSGGGLYVDDDFFLEGKMWRKLETLFDERAYVRIFTDTVSFDQLCYFRDALISRKSLYNWIVTEGSVIHFVEGYDGRVQ